MIQAWTVLRLLEMVCGLLMRESMQRGETDIVSGAIWGMHGVGNRADPEEKRKESNSDEDWCSKDDIKELASLAASGDVT